MGQAPHGGGVHHRAAHPRQARRPRHRQRRVGDIDTTDSFSDRVYQGELARENVWETWARAGGALPHEVSRMEEALSWPGQVLANGHATEGKVLLAWAFCIAYGRPLSRMMRQRGWSRTTFYQGGG